MKRFAAYPLLVAGCSGPLSTLEPGGPAAADIAWLWWGMLAGAAVITVFMVGLVLLALGAPRPVREGRWTLGLGLGLSMVILTPVLAAGLWVGERIIPRDDGVVTVEAHAWQWNWRFTHADAEGAPVESENTLHIPAGQPVDVLITSEDVIHSFWVPRLAGKLDAIPGRTNRARIMADEPGRYAGLCAEFCGQGHARMRFDVVAHADWPPVLNGDGTEAK
ncbi:cytochrome c oxidase subunit II [Rhodobacteraceae bacterium 2376]|uniref:Cytochrome c oxidase subunit II n=1 Tax=Rhabdonatronobacter sediminivivens TaxID=2743469 RepID=A0A7Z0I075_9RHOB|nr:cytochrome c oxidase subunit II [Rhabdonatronobacter sediminivivens]NYS25531.1 cytochrome c oxidase subunit II [Rhabdonatronobacter sediminivivens]